MKISGHNLPELNSCQERPSWIEVRMIKCDPKLGLSISDGFIYTIYYS